MQLQRIQKQLPAGRHLFLAGTVLTLAALVITACQKKADKPYSRDAFDVASVKEWFYGTFKKSAEYSAYDRSYAGSKQPDWSQGKQIRVGDYDAIEFPLSRQKARVTIPETAAATEAERSRIAQSSVARILFIKKGNKTLVREAQYIPDQDYLARHQYDISGNGFATVDKDFSGSIQVNDWAGNELSRSVLRDGKVQKRVKGTQLLNRNTPVNGGRIACDGVLVTEYERECEVHIYSDNQVTLQCGEWYPTGNQWCYEGEVANPCEDPASPQCACQEYGICEGGDGSGGEENCEARQQQMEGSPDDALSSTGVLNQTQNSRTKYYEWTFYKQNFGLWKFISHEKGVHVKDNGFWRWESLTHESFSRVGSVIGGSITCTINSAQSTHGMAFATMTLNYNITISLICAGSPLSWGNDYTSTKQFNIND